MFTTPIAPAIHHALDSRPSWRGTTLCAALAAQRWRVSLISPYAAALSRFSPACARQTNTRISQIKA